MARWRRSGTVNTRLEAASRRLDTLSAAEKQQAKRTQKLQQPWQDEAYMYADTLGEVKYAYRYVGKAIGKLRPFPAIIDPNDQDRKPIPIEDYRVGADPENGVEGTPLPEAFVQAAMAEVQRVRDEHGGVGQILRTAGENMFLVGEGYFVGTPETPAQPDRPGQPGQPGQPEMWSSRSVSEIRESDAKPDRYEHRGDPGSQWQELPEGTKVIRFWNPHPRWGNLADSSLRGALDTCDELLTLSRSIRGAGLSRIAGAGVAVFAQELSFGPHDPAKDNSSAEDHGDPVTQKILEAMMTPINDPTSASAAVPLMFRVPAQMIKDKSWGDRMTFERGIDETLASQREELRGVLATSIDLPKEILTGKGDVNHWSAWQIDDDVFKGHVEPDAQMIFDAWTTSLFRPALLEGGQDQALVGMACVWYDASALVTRPNRGDEADKAFDRYAIKWSTYRAVHNFTENDAPDDDELDLRARIKAAERGRPEESPSNTTDTQSPPAPSAAARAERLALTAAVAGRGGVTHLGQRLNRIDLDLRAKLVAAADSAMRRAMTKAGVKVKAKVSGRGENGNRYGAHVAAIRGLPAGQICATLGRSLVTALGLDDEKLLDDAFTEYGDQFDAWVADSQERTRSRLEEMGAAVVSLAALHDRDRAQAWSVLRTDLYALAQKRLYGETLADEGKGEFAGTLVPTSVIRAAMARAGGAESREGASGLDSRGLPVLAGEPPALGVANGPSTLDALAEVGVQPSTYQWVYGISTRPFEPHLALDGVEFEAFDDDVLRNDDSWPDVPYFTPGDHDGCECDAMPTYVSTEEARPEFDPAGEPLSEAASARRTA